jgi:hypothetical protein
VKDMSETRKDDNAIHKEVCLAMADAPPAASVVGHLPKAKTTSSQRVRCFQILTAAAGKPLTKSQRRRDKKKCDARKKISRAKFISKFAKNDNGDWITPITDKERLPWSTPSTKEGRLTLLSTFSEKAMTETLLQRDSPVFFSGDNSCHIDGVPPGSKVIPVNSLFVVDTTLGFKFPFDSQEQDQVLLVPREQVISHNFQPNHANLLDALHELSSLTKKTGVQRGKDRIVAFQNASNNKYLTPGIFPLRNACGTGIRSLEELQANHHQAIFRYVKNSEMLAMKSMSPLVARGSSRASQLVPFATFPGAKKGKSTRMFSSIATALNVCLNSHKDVDAFYGVVTTLVDNRNKIFLLDDMITCYFTFPTLGFAVALRPGDILYFNPTIYHSVSSRRNFQENIWCTSLYTKNAVVGGNNNAFALDPHQNEVMMHLK